jgi:ABC-2 type transport system permease protein
VRTLALSFYQLPYEQKSYWRNPAAAVFTFTFPILFLVIFASLNRNGTIDFLGGLSYNQYFVPGILVFGVISATYSNLAMTITYRRESGTLKRLRGTPIPAASVVGGLLLNAIAITIILTALLTTVGVLFYDVTFPGHWAALLITLAVGAASFCAIGVAVSTFVPNVDAAPAIVNFVLFPILFLSGVFFPLENDTALARIGNLFPVRHYVNAVFAAFDPRLPHGLTHGFVWGDLAVVAAWGVAGTIIAVRRFRWSPSRK